MCYSQGCLQPDPMASHTSVNEPSLRYQIDQRQRFIGPAWLIFHKLLHALLMLLPSTEKLFQY